MRLAHQWQLVAHPQLTHRPLLLPARPSRPPLLQVQPTARHPMVDSATGDVQAVRVPIAERLAALPPIPVVRRRLLRLGFYPSPDGRPVSAVDLGRAGRTE